MWLQSHWDRQDHQDQQAKLVLQEPLAKTASGSLVSQDLPVHLATRQWVCLVLLALLVLLLLLCQGLLVYLAQEGKVHQDHRAQQVHLAQQCKVHQVHLDYQE